jgi:formyl-CoA transferase
VSDNVVKKYYDVIAQAESGLISLNGETNDVKISTSIVDAFSGMKLAFAISSCLYFREKHHRGQRIVVSMKGSAFDLLEQNLVAASLTQKNPYKVGNMDNAIAPFGVFSVSDGSIVLAIGNDSLWTLFVDSFKHYNSSLQNEIFATNDSRVEHITLLKTEIEKVFQNFDKRSLLQLLVSLQIPCSEVKTMIDVLKDQENFDEGLLTTYVVPTVGPIVVPTGGISFSESSPISCTPSPILKKRQ